MSRQYHYLIAGFPDLFFDDSKVSVNLNEFRSLLEENLPEDDVNIIRLHFYRYDNQNILIKLQDKGDSYDQRGNLSEADIEALFNAVKEGSDSAYFLGIPSYLGKFVEAFKADIPLFEGKSWELQLSELYYDYVTSQSNVFVRNWFLFERDMQNILTAGQCRKYNMSVEKQLIGQSEIVEKLSRSNARDFGLDNEFPFVEAILKTIEEDDLREYEKKIDRIKWDYLDDAVFFHFFTIEKLFSFVVRLSIIERWLSLDKETGKELLNELLNNLEASYEFPEEFKL